MSNSKNKFSTSTPEIDKLKDIADIFLRRVLDQNAALTDLAQLSHFAPLESIERSIGPGTKPGYYKFEVEFVYEDPITGQDKTLNKTWEALGVDWKGSVIAKTKAIFGVDISSVYNEPLYKVLTHIAENFKKFT